MNEERLEHQKEERLRNLKEIFKETIEKTIKDTKNVLNTDSEGAIKTYVETASNDLVYEVRIRINENFITKNNIKKGRWNFWVIGI